MGGKVRVVKKELRRVRTWDEARDVLVEHEGLTAERTAVTGAAKGGPPAKAKKACYEARDSKDGKCDKPGCPCDHTPAVVAAARRKLAAKKRLPDGGKAGGGKGVGKGVKAMPHGGIRR